MRIFVDADSCPGFVRTIVSKAAEKRQIKTYFVANREIPIGKNRMTTMVVTEARDQSADEYIVDQSTTDDLVITRDIPLAHDLVLGGRTVINDRGMEFTRNNIRERLSVRNLMYEMRTCGLQPEKSGTMGTKEKQNFANRFDTVVTKMLKNRDT